MPDNIASNGQATQNGQQQTAPTTAGRDEQRNDPRHQPVQPGRDLEYYRNFLEDLVAVIRDGNADAVSRIVSLIRSSASNDEIFHAIQQLQAA